MSACAGVADYLHKNLCWYASALRSPVGTALEANSAAITALPAWPAGLPVTNTAGDISLSVQIGNLFGRTYDIGDVAVTLNSATAHHTTGAPDIQRCPASLSKPWALLTNRCSHLNLPSNPAIIKCEPARAGAHWRDPGSGWPCCGRQWRLKSEQQPSSSVTCPLRAPGSLAKLR